MATAALVRAGRIRADGGISADMRLLATVLEGLTWALLDIADTLAERDNNDD